MATNPPDIAQLDFSYGVSRDTAPHLIDPRGVYDHLNGLYDEGGSPFKRGGSANFSNAAFGSSGIRWIADTYVDAGQRTIFANSADFGVLAADDATPVNLGSDGLSVPKPYAVLKGMAFVGGGYIYAGSRKTAPYSTGTVTATNGSTTVTGSGTTWNTLTDAGMLFQAASTERVYAVASIDSTTQITLREPYEGSTGAGKSYTLHNVYKITGPDPYVQSEVYSVCANRLISHSNDSFYFSEIERPHVPYATIEGTQVTNEHKVPEGRILGHATIGLSSIVFTTAGIRVIDGLAFSIVDPDGNPQHRNQLLSAEHVLWGAPGIAAWSQALVVPTLDGIYVMDGVSQPFRVSNPFDELYRNYVERGYRPGLAEVYRGHYLLPILSASGARVNDLLAIRLDRPVRSSGQNVSPLSRFAGDGGEINCFAVRRSDTPGTEPLLLGAQARDASRIVDCTPYFEPDADHKNDADGTTPIWMLITRDYETGSLTENVVRAIRTRYELVDAGSDNPVLRFSYGMGRREETGFTVWDGNDWAIESGSDPDDLFWEDDEDDVFYALDCIAPEDNAGLTPYRCRVNKRARYIRFRLICNDPCASLRLRSLELFVRESQAMRR